MGRQKCIRNTTCYPDHVIESIARCLLPSVLEDLEDENIQKEFREYMAQESKLDENDEM